jgi:hypothetical protein
MLGNMIRARFGQDLLDWPHCCSRARPFRCVIRRVPRARKTRPMHVYARPSGGCGTPGVGGHKQTVISGNGDSRKKPVDAQ